MKLNKSLLRENNCHICHLQKTLRISRSIGETMYETVFAANSQQVKTACKLTNRSDYALKISKKISDHDESDPAPILITAISEQLQAAFEISKKSGSLNQFKRNI